MIKVCCNIYIVFLINRSSQVTEKVIYICHFGIKYTFNMTLSVNLLFMQWFTFGHYFKILYEIISNILSFNDLDLTLI